MPRPVLPPSLHFSPGALLTRSTSDPVLFSSLLFPQPHTLTGFRTGFVQRALARAVRTLALTPVGRELLYSVQGDSRGVPLDRCATGLLESSEKGVETCAFTSELGNEEESDTRK